MRIAMLRRLRSWLLWPTPIVVAGVGGIILAAGFFQALSGDAGEALMPRSLAAVSMPWRAIRPDRPGPRRAPRFIGLGDSLTRGTGDSPGGSGYFGLVAAELRRRSAGLEVANLAVDGLESRDLLEQLRLPESRALVADSDWIAVSIGGNDLSHTLGRWRAAEVGAVERARLAYAENLRQILTALRRENAVAPIMLIGLYNPAETGDDSAAADLVLTWNSTLERVVAAVPGALVVPAFDLFAAHPERLAADRLHPNRAGYQAIAVRWLQASGGPN